MAILGFFRSRIGIGRAAELLAKELEGRGHKVQRIDVTRQLGVPVTIEADGLSDLATLDREAVTDIILHMNPPEFYEALKLLPVQFWQDRALIGFFAWELGVAPAWWAPALAASTEVWVPSTFVATSLKRLAPENAHKIKVSPHQIDETYWRPARADERLEARRLLDLPERAFVVFTSFAMTSSFERKNPSASISAFKAAFPGVDNVRLIIRCLDAGQFREGLRDLRSAVDNDPRIALVTDTLNGGTIRDFYFASDTYISLHRGEGFGLNLAEALATGLSLVATAQDLSETFQRHSAFYRVSSRPVPVNDRQRMYTIGAEASWSDPDVAIAAQHLKDLYAIYEQSPNRGSISARV